MGLEERNRGRDGRTDKKREKNKQEEMEKMTDKKAERERSQATEPNTERGSGAAVCVYVVVPKRTHLMSGFSFFEGFVRPRPRPRVQLLCASPSCTYGGKVSGGQTYITTTGGSTGSTGQTYHSECFKCAACEQVITGQYSTQRKAKEKNNPRNPRDPREQGNENVFYHPSCYQQVFSPECCVCLQKMLPDSRGLVQYSTTPFWQQKFCTKHATDGTRRCFACQRMESVRERHIVLKEKRPRAAGVRAICLSCALSVVAGAEDVQVIYREMRSFFAKNALELPLSLPIHLCETDALNEATTQRSRSAHGHSTMGMTLTEQRTTVKHTSAHTSQVISKRNEVSAILILHGMPRMLFCSVLAHELTHAYLKLGDFEMTLQIEEGLCQLMSYLYLKSQQGSIHSTAEQEKERVYHMNKIFEDESVLYGEGFRMCFDAYTKYGLKNVLNHVKLCGNLPM